MNHDRQPLNRNSAAGAFRSADLVGVIAFLVLWGGSTAYLGLTGADVIFPFVSLGIFGIGLSAVGWLTTRGIRMPRIDVARPGRESAALLIYLGFYAVIFLGFGMSALRDQIPDGRTQEIAVMAAKIAAHIVLPAILMAALGARISPIFGSGLRSKVFWRTLIVISAILLALLAVVSPSLKNVAEVGPTLTTLAWAAPATYLWVTVEAGLNEEFLFRGLLQTRLSAWFRSAWTGIVITSVIFGLAHAPGLFLRGGPDVHGWSTDPLQVVAYTIAALTPVSLFFGFLYARTKSLLLVILLHGMVDVLPALADFIKLWA